MPIEKRLGQLAWVNQKNLGIPDDWLKSERDGCLPCGVMILGIFNVAVFVVHGVLILPYLIASYAL